MKSKSLSSLFVMTVLALALSLFFQNCNRGLNAQKSNRLTSGLLGDVSNPALGRSFLSARSDRYHSVSRGFIFYGKKSIAETTADKVAAQICDYPSLQNCHINSEALGRGTSTILESGLNANSNVHGIAFQFYSDGFLSKNTSAYFAVGLRGQGMMMQVESYFGINTIINNGEGNTVYPSTCSGAIFKERTIYNLEVYASRDNKIGYKVKDANGNLILQKVVQDTFDIIDKNLTESFIAHVFDIGYQQQG